MALGLAAAGDDPSDRGPDAGDDARDDVRREAHDGVQDDDDDEYAVEIGRAATNAGVLADAGDAGEDAGDSGRERRRHGRGTEVMTAVEIADVLGMPAVLDGYVDAGPVEPEAEQPQPRSTHVMSAVEVEEMLAGGSAAEPAPQDDGSARGKGRKRRGRKRR